MGRDVWWDWRSDWSSRTEPVLSTDKQRMDAMVELASRCILLEDLPDNVTAKAIDTYMDQFGTVLGVKLVKSPVDQKFMGRAFVELDSAKKRLEVLKQFRDYLFQLGGGLRPVRAVEVTPALMIDHPWRRNPNFAVPRTVSKTERNHPLFLALKEKERNAKQRLDDEKAQHLESRGLEVSRAQTQDHEMAEAKEKLDMIAEVKNGSIAVLRRLHGLQDGPSEDYYCGDY